MLKSILSETARAVAVGSGALLGVMAIVIIALTLLCWWICRCNSLAKLMPVVASLMVLNVVLQSVNVYLKWKHNSGRSEPQQEQRQPLQPLQPKPPISPKKESLSGPPPRLSVESSGQSQ